MGTFPLGSPVAGVFVASQLVGPGGIVLVTRLAEGVTHVSIQSHSYHVFLALPRSKGSKVPGLMVWRPISVGLSHTWNFVTAKIIAVFMKHRPLFILISWGQRFLMNCGSCGQLTAILVHTSMRLESFPFSGGEHEDIVGSCLKGD